MNLNDWQSDERLVQWARDLFEDPRWKLLAGVMEEEHPKNYQKPQEISADRELGVIYGYDRYGNNLAALARSAPPTGVPEATFAPPELEKEED
jgi:hypothetical protein